MFKHTHTTLFCCYLFPLVRQQCINLLGIEGDRRNFVDLDLVKCICCHVLGSLL